MVHLVPFLVAEIQAKYSARVFAGKIQIPNKQTRMKEVDDSIADYLKEHATIE